MLYDEFMLQLKNKINIFKKIQNRWSQLENPVEEWVRLEE